MAIGCPACGNENPDDALYCAVCQNVFRKEKSDPGRAARVFRDIDAPPVPAFGGEGMGQLLFEKRTPLVARLGLSVLSLALVAGSAAGLGVKDLSFVGPAIGLLIGLLLAWATALAWVSVLRCYEGGVEHRGLAGTVALRYEQVGSFTWGAVRHHQNGIYTSTNYFFEFEPRPGIPSGRIRFTTSLRSEDEELNGLRDHISAIIGARLVEDYKRAGKAAWTPSLRFLPDALEYTPSGLFGKGTPFRLGLELVDHWSIDQGEFKLWSRSGGDPVMQEKVSAPNFFPGLFLLSRLTGR